MAIVRFTDGTSEAVSPEVGAEIWRILTGEIEGDDEQQRYCERVSKIYLNWRRADCPQSYLAANQQLIESMGHTVAMQQPSNAELKI